MKLSDTIEETFLALSSNKARTGLTILGIVIGISSVIVMVSVGQGATSSIQASIESTGSNLLMITPGALRTFGAGARSAGGTAQSLTVDDATAIVNQVSSVQYMTPEVTGRYQVVYKGNNSNTSVMGTSDTYPQVRNLSVDQGVFITSQDVDNVSKIAVIGPTVVTDLFGTDAVASDAIGQTIKINKMEFKVVGVTKAKGGSGFQNQDDRIYIPYTVSQRYFTGNKYLSEIDLQISSPDLMTSAQNDVTSLLLSRHNIADSTSADFTVQNQADILSSISSVSQTLTILLGAIAGISLLVGGIGIMNMMLTTVTERTREIGLRKAIGAKAKDITFQFLTEAVVLTFSGGVIGVFLGWIISWGIKYFNLYQTQVSLFSVILAVAVSAAIGIVFGYYPAKRAAKLNPIEALRYE
ncbi:MAG: ABC transporter permease [Candidatus Staskawiczbacteria bacterium]|nr:ABC transporter permease [Candidatus Staskawiczbacteria bacterium]